MKVAALLQWAYEQLLEKEIELPQLDAEVLLCHVLKLERIQLHIYPEREVGPDQEAVYRKLIELRKGRRPVPYLTNRQEFMGLDFYVDQRVLIPRSDTEILVEEALRLAGQMKTAEPLRVLDLGTGSGAIAVSLAKGLAHSQVTAVDISTEALSVARQNAAWHGVAGRMTFLEGSLFTALESTVQSFHLVLSNPPYIPRQVISTLSDQVKAHEPLLALDGGTDGLDFYRQIVAQAPDHLIPGGWLALEIGWDQGPAVAALMEAWGFGEIAVLKDLAGLDRVVRGQRPGSG